MSSSKGGCFQAAANFVVKNPDFLLVHGIVSCFGLSTSDYAWVKKDTKVYDVEHDKWYDSSEWERCAVEEYVYKYEEVVRLLDYTTHSGPWTENEMKRVRS